MTQSSEASTSPSTVPPKAAAQPTPAKASRGKFVALAILLSVAAAGGSYYAHARHFEETDDAQIDGNITTVSPRIEGTVKSVFVSDNQPVKAGDLLVELDTKDLEVALARAKAQVAQAVAQLQAEDPSVYITEASNTAALKSASTDIESVTASLAAARNEVSQTESQLAQAEANDKNAELDRDRTQKLVQTGAVSQAEADTRINTAAATSAAVSALRQALAAAKDRVAEQQARLTTSHTHLTEVRSNAPRQVETRKASVEGRRASLTLAQAELAQAELNLSYAKIVAPISGIIGKKGVNVGDRIAPGQALMAIAQITDLYVTANYRETQLRDMKPGQAADVHVDALELTLQGKVETVGGATGSRFSVLPPENAAGNYVKVVQRIPVRIRLTEGQSGTERLRIGMSVEPEVLVR